MKTVKIVTPDGVQAGCGTKVYAEGGQEISGVTAIDIEIRPDAVTTATMSLFVSGDITAHPLLGLETVREAAEWHGYKLVPIDQ